MIDWLEWSEPYTDKFGTWVRATPDERFWARWSRSKHELRANGYRVMKNDKLGWVVMRKAEREMPPPEEDQTKWEVVSPYWKTLFPYQEEGVRFALAHPNCYIGDEMGLGKSCQAISVINSDESVKKVLIVCPASLRRNWVSELKDWLCRESMTVAEIKDRKNWLSAEIVVVSYSVVEKHRDSIDKFKPDLLIVDECQCLKDPKRKRTRAVLGGRAGGGRAGMKPIEARRRIFLSGTPITNRPIDIWPIVRVIDKNGLGKNKMEFAKRYCDAYRSRFGWDFTGASNLEELQRHMRSRFFIRRRKADVLTDLPEKIRQVVPLSLRPNERPLLDQLETLVEQLGEKAFEVQFTSAADVGNLDEGDAVAFTEMSEIRKSLAEKKIPQAAEFIEAACDSHPVVVFGHHADVLREIANRLPYRYGIITGSTPMDERQDLVEKFQAGELRAMFGNRAMETGHTLTRSSHVIFVETDWVPAAILQREDRCHRIGQKDSVLVQHLVFEDSLEISMLKRVLEKIEVIEKAIG